MLEVEYRFLASTVPVPTYGDSEQNNQIAAIAAYLRRWLPWLPLVAVTALALVVNAWGLSEAGYGNPYYGAFDPGGFITVDKPPVFLWVDAISARLLGYGSLSLLLPSAIAGASSVALLWLIMRRYFSVTAATVAALVLALTPISVAVNRLNLPEPFLLLALIGAAGCILRSLEPGRWLWWTMGAGLLVGLAFNTKMLVGWVPGPALGLAIVAGVSGPWWRTWSEWVPRLAVFGSVALLASVSWLLVVDAWPASSRPYIGGSTDNTVYDLMLGYNGFDRVGGENGWTNGDGRQQSAGTGSRVGPNPVGAGGIIAGEPGALRMFDEANGGQIAWFLPFAAIGGLISLWRWRADHIRRGAVVLWLGWTALFLVVFSYQQGIYHSYYTAALAPGVAALVGVSIVALPDLVRRHKAWLAAGVGMALVTLYVQLVVAGRFDDFFQWVAPFTVIAVLCGLVLLVASTWHRRLPVLAGMAVVVGGLLLLPAAWSSYEAAHASSNATLPQAGPRNGGVASRSFGSQAFDAGIASLAGWLEENRDSDARWDLAVPSAQNASTLIAEHGLSVMALGGFSGEDPAITVREFGEYVGAGEVRYVLVTLRRTVAPRAFSPNAAGALAVMSAAQSVCEKADYRTVTLGTVYDCEGKASALLGRPLVTQNR